MIDSTRTRLPFRPPAIMRGASAVAAFFAGLALLWESGDATAASERPNVIVILADQHRMGTFPGEPHTSVVAPNLARLAREGATFTNAIANYPVCSPYRAMLLTGRAPYRTGVIDNNITLPDDGATFGHLFRNQGYRTGYIGKWHLGQDGKPLSGRHGFEHFEVWRGTNNHRRSSYWDTEEEEFVDYVGYNATGMTDHALEFIDRHRDENFLLLLSLNPPHSNFLDAPEKYHEIYRGKEIEKRPNMRAELEGDFNGWTRRARADVDTIHRGYLAHVSGVDAEIGRIFERLESLGIADNTLIVYSSDHGEMLGSHGRMGKRQPFEESIRIPFVMRWPGVIEAASRPATVIGSVDFMATICGLVGLELPDGLDGYDLSGVLRGEAIERPAFQPIMHISRDRAGVRNHPAELFRGVRTERFTYAVMESGPWLLFDNSADPYQLKNLIDDPNYADEQEMLHELTTGWLKDYGDPFEVRKPE